MKRLNNITLSIITIICIISASVIFYYSYTSISAYSDTHRLYKNQNERLKEKIKDSENDINSINSKMKLVDNRLNKLQEKVKTYEALNLVNKKEDFEKYLLSSVRGNLDKDRSLSINKKNTRLRKLRSTYFNDYEVANDDEASSNILLNALLRLEYQYSNINKAVIKNNSIIYKNVGLYEYFNTTTNYFIKSELASSINKGIYPVEENNISLTDKSLLALKNNFYIASDTLLYPSATNYNYLSNLKSNIDNELKVSNLNISSKENLSKDNLETLKKIDNLCLFGIDVFSQNIDYEKDYDILDKTFETNKGVQVLRYLVDNRNRVYLIEERLNGEAKSLTYVNASADPFVQTDINNYKIYYFNINSDNNTKNKYNYSLDLLNKYNK